MYLEKHGIPQEKIISQDKDSVVLEVFIPETSDFFDGHFPEIHLVPAVAQMDIASHFCKKYFNTKLAMTSAKRLKFTSPVKPNTLLHFSLKYNEEKSLMTYKLTGADGEKTYSTGNFVINR